MTTWAELADLLFPDVALLPETIAEQYPPRALKPGAKVTRFAPSPTGFLTIGGLYASMISERMARQSGGLFYVRIEDTDKKREVQGSVEDMIESLERFGIRIDEGPTSEGEETGRYGPYRQSSRVGIYQAWIKRLLEQDLAYPCFCTEDQLNEIRDRQQAAKENTGYYGKWAVHRNMTIDEVREQLTDAKPFVVRLKSPGSADNRIRYVDMIKGETELPENDQDIVLLKSDGVPTYHFAHAVDDHLMGTTHVFRGDEWISSVPIHLQLFRILGFRAPEYGHLAPLMKMDGASKRKFSKRKDRDATANYYRNQGYPSLAVTEYFMTLINSDYEEWRLGNPSEPYTEFRIGTDKMNVSGALFDLNKLNDVSKDVISRFSAEEVYASAAEWARACDAELFRWLDGDKSYSVNILGVGRTPEKPRKDLAKWSDVKQAVAFYYDEWFEMEAPILPLPAAVTDSKAKEIVRDFIRVLDLGDDKDTWFGKVKNIAETHGFAREMKQYKKNPSAYAGHVGDVAAVVRAVLTGRLQTPDLYEMMQVMGDSRVRSRLGRYVSA
ncbi:glutamate--tRNA ligase [Paenibacillus hemerocallicola]|uniref:Glutamate--tRNA ligase n=1 Tax=Paenibacillus hemerocallicola TaxID=1172614 RepID=A0A5C4SXN8_9BACL|nr:glutamate--tRNA ligase [Paenibacillus hemerocallicola]TNJ60337.1 glutamate--tRNA ligase [Paenibacillus hemerocallicola]